MADARSELDAAWVEWQSADLYLKWRRSNPGESAKLDAFRSGGARPLLATATGRAFVREVAAWIASAPVVTPPPAATLGTLLPDRIGRSTGAVINVSTIAQLATVVNSTAPLGSTVNLTASVVGGGFADTAMITRGATAAAPITVTCSPGVQIKNHGGFDVRGSYLRFEGLEFYNDQAPNLSQGCYTINPNSGAHHIEIEKCVFHGAPAGNNLANGIYIGSGCGDNVQIWDCRISYVGRASGLDHGIYWSVSPSNGVVANCEIYQPFSYGAQIYSSSPGHGHVGTIVTCCTFDGGQTGMADPRGGMVWGDEDDSSTRNCRFVGILSTNAPNTPGFHQHHGGQGNQVFDCLSFGNAGGDFDSWYTVNPAVYANCSHVDPLYVNRAGRDYRLQPGSPAIGKINPARYGYVPPLDINGNPRVTADAGCYRA